MLDPENELLAAPAFIVAINVFPAVGVLNILKLPVFVISAIFEAEVLAVNHDIIFVD